jgi:hypothetical protein
VIENMVARDGVEPPTPAFSGLYSTIRISLILFIVDPSRRRFSCTFVVPIGAIYCTQLPPRLSCFRSVATFARRSATMIDILSIASRWD